jgi:hypothetical protein
MAGFLFLVAYDKCELLCGVQRRRLIDVFNVTLLAVAKVSV